MKFPSFRLFAMSLAIAAVLFILCAEILLAEAYDKDLVVIFEKEAAENGSTSTRYQPTNVSLTWQCSSGGILLPMASFDVHYGRNATEFNESHSIDSATIFTPELDLEPNTIYHWRVDAFDGEVHFWQGSQWQFTTGSARGEEPAAPELKSPSNGASDLDSGNLSLVWNAKTGMRYNVFLTKDGEAEREIYIGVSGNVAVEVEKASTYFWRVVALDSHNIAKSSEVWAFSTSDPDAVPDSVNLVPKLPADMAVDEEWNLSLTWSCTSDPEIDMASFDVHLGRNASEFDLSHRVDGETSIYTPGQLESDSRYYWQVTVYDGSGNSWGSDLWQFTTAAPEALPEKDVEIEAKSPKAGSISQPTDQSFLWNISNSSAEIVSFEVRYGRNSQEFNEPHRIDGPLGIYSPQTDLKTDRIYFWQVTALDSDGKEWRSPIWQFTTAAPEALPEKDVEIEAKSPKAGSISQPTDQSFLWNISNSSAEIVSFEVRYGRNSQEFNEPHRIDGPLGIYSPQTDLKTDRIYFWQVTALDSDGKEWRSPIWQFKTAASPSDSETPSSGGGTGGGSGIPGAEGGCSVAYLGSLPLLLIPLVMLLRR